MYLKTEAVILRKKNFAEADKILTIYTRDYGKISCIAKGARRTLSRKSGHIELGSWCKVFVAKGKSLDLLTEVELKKAFGIENLTPEIANKIYHFLELADSLTAHNQKNKDVFILLVNFLKKVDSEEDFNLLSSVFKIKLLASLGFFSAENLEKTGTSSFLKKLQNDDFDTLKKTIKTSSENYLKLLSFLDSIIENVSEKKLHTTKFLNG